jgi:hypothetical protein
MPNHLETEFWKIIEAGLPEYANDRLLDGQPKQQLPDNLEEPDDREERQRRITTASYDKRIADYFFYGIGNEESLIAQLQRGYDLNEEDACQAINMGIGHQGEVVDYGDEA